MCHGSTPEYFVLSSTEIIMDTEATKPLIVLDAFQQCLCIQLNQVSKEGDNGGKGAREREGEKRTLWSLCRLNRRNGTIKSRAAPTAAPMAMPAIAPPLKPDLVAVHSSSLVRDIPNKTSQHAKPEKGF